MLTRQRSRDGEIDLFRGTALVGHLFSLGRPWEVPELHVYTHNYSHHTIAHSYEEADTWILEKLQELGTTTRLTPPK